MNNALTDARDFVRTPDFFGPDRRRLQAPDYAGPFRRADDNRRGDTIDIDDTRVA